MTNFPELLAAAIHASPWLLSILLTVYVARAVRVGPLLQDLMWYLLGILWEFRLRANGASTKERRRFIRDYALTGRGQSP